jgi:AraC family transcriptional regulator
MATPANAINPPTATEALKAAPQTLIDPRIARARVLLETTRLPVAEIAWRVGYENAARFTALFKRETGRTPGAVRQA